MLLHYLLTDDLSWDSSPGGQSSAQFHRKIGQLCFSLPRACSRPVLFLASCAASWCKLHIIQETENLSMLMWPFIADISFIYHPRML